MTALKLVLSFSILALLLDGSLAWSLGSRGHVTFMKSLGVENATQKRTFFQADPLRQNARLLQTGVNSSIPSTAFLANPLLETAINNGVYGVFDAAINGDLAIVGYEGFAFLPGQLFPAFASFSGVNRGRLELVDIIYQNFTYGAASASICKNTDKRFVVQALLFSKDPSKNPFLNPVNVMVVIYEYYPNGTFNKTPRAWYNLSSAQPNLFESAASYSGVAKISEDCNYIFFTAALGADSPTLTCQTIGIIRINDDFTLSNPVSISYPSTGILGYYYFAQTAWMKKDARSNKYTLIVPSNSYNLVDIQGLFGTAAMFSYTFDPAANTLTQIDVLPVPQYIQGLAVSNGRKAVAILDCVITSEQSSFSRRCKTAYANGSPNSGDEIRFYNVNLDSSMSFDYSMDLNGWGVSGIFSVNDDSFILSWSPALLNTFTFNPSDPSNPNLSFSPSIISRYEFKNSKITLQDNQGASPLPFGLAVNRNQLLVGGMPTLLQQDNQLFTLQ